MGRDESKAAHAAMARAKCRAIGLADCMHYAPDACRRADMLYARLNAAGDWPLDVGLRADGTMVAIGNTMSVFEAADPCACFNCKQAIPEDQSPVHLHEKVYCIPCAEDMGIQDDGGWWMLRGANATP